MNERELSPHRKHQQPNMSSGSMKKVDGEWKKIQQRTFTNWVNDKLRGQKMAPDRPIVDLAKDFKDGVRLIELLEILAKPQKLGRYNRNPRMKAHALENLNTALTFIKNQKIKLVNISECRMHGIISVRQWKYIHALYVVHAYFSAFIVCGVYLEYVHVPMYT